MLFLHHSVYEALLDLPCRKAVAAENIFVKIHLFHQLDQKKKKKTQ